MLVTSESLSAHATFYFIYFYYMPYFKHWSGGRKSKNQSLHWIPQGAVDEAWWPFQASTLSCHKVYKKDWL